MTKLLSANLLRLRKSMLFWGTLAVSFGFGAFTVYTRLSDRIKYGEHVQLDFIIFFYSMVIGLFASVFISLFFGTEYSDGAIRNKVAVGHSRFSIYFSNLLTAYVVSLLSTAATLLAVFALGVPTIGAPTIPVPFLLTTLLGTLVMETALCAIFTAITMNCAKKAAAAVSCILLFFGLMMASSIVQARLDAPEYIADYIITVDGLDQTEPKPNPQYLRGMEREVYEFAYDLLPTGQASQYIMMTGQHPVRMALCSAALTVLFSGAGAALFRRKDLK